MNDEESGYREMADRFAEVWPNVRKLGADPCAEPLREYLDFQAFQHRIGELAAFARQDIDAAQTCSDMAAAIEMVRLCVFGELDQSERYQTVRYSVRQMEKACEQGSVPFSGATTQCDKSEPKP